MFGVIMEKEEMVKRNERLIYLVLKRYHLLDKIEEYYDVGAIGLVRGINTYDKSKGYKETTYLYRCIDREIMRELIYEKRNKRNFEGNIFSLDLVMGNEKGASIESIIKDPSINVEEDYIKNERYLNLYKAIAELKPEWRELICKKFGIGYQKKTFNELAKEKGCSVNCIRDKIRRALAKLKFLIEEEEGNED